MEKAFSIDTIVPPSWEFQLGLSHLLLKQYDQALTRFNRAIQRTPKVIYISLYLACAYAELGRLDDAKKAIKTVLDLSPQYTIRKAAENFPYRIDEVRNRFLDSLREAGLPEE